MTPFPTLPWSFTLKLFSLHHVAACWFVFDYSPVKIIFMHWCCVWCVRNSAGHWSVWLQSICRLALGRSGNTETILFSTTECAAGLKRSAERLQYLLLKNYQSFFSLRIALPLESTSSLTSSATSWSASSWFISSPRSSHLASVIITTIIHHPIILPFQTQNFPISQILPSIDIWHLFRLISRIPRLHYGFFLCLFFSSLQLSLFPSVLVLLSQVSYLSHNRLFLDFYF